MLSLSKHGRRSFTLRRAQGERGNLHDSCYFLECGRYIERNPVRAGIVQQAEDYPWSSYRHYALGERDPLIEDDPYYTALGADPLTRQQRYREFVKIAGPYDTVVDRVLVEAHF